MILRPHQLHVLEETLRLRSSGLRRLCVTAPCGSGKSLMMVEEAIRSVKAGQRVGLFTPRKLLTDQIIGYFEDMKIPFSVRAAEYENYHYESCNIQICSTKTEHSRVNKTLKLPQLQADLVLIDEVHMQGSGINRQVIEQNYNDGADIIGYTATPVNLRGMFQELIIGGTPSQLRTDGHMLPAHMYELGCPDLSKVKRLSTGEFNATQLRNSGYVQCIVGDVIKHYKRLNPHGLPTILFAPGLPESKWFVDQFDNAGIHAAHIDGDDIYRDGVETKRSPAAKENLLADVRSGRVRVLCNRFVCREGVDIPELFYGILACPIGSLTSYLQSIGRLLRPDPNNPGMRFVRIADHGGNRDRHGSPNEDRQWQEIWGLTSPQLEQVRRMEVQNGNKEKGFPCPKCHLVWGAIPPSGTCTCGCDLRPTFQCPNCSHKHREWPKSATCEQCGETLRWIRKKRVKQRDGELTYVPDEDYRPRHIRKEQGSEELWARRFWGFRKYRPEKNLAQAWGAFVQDHLRLYNCWPPRNLKLMPKSEMDWYTPVGKLDMERLY